MKAPENQRKQNNKMKKFKEAITPNTPVKLGIYVGAIVAITAGAIWLTSKKKI